MTPKIPPATITTGRGREGVHVSDGCMELKGISKSFPGVSALDCVSFSVKKGSIHGFLGPNGAGKTTTLKIIAGLCGPSSGEIYFDGKLANSVSCHRSIGLLLEDTCLYEDMQVIDYLKLVGGIFGEKPALLDSQIEKVMEQVDIVHVKKRLIGNLSKGYKQRVGLAASLVHNPDILLLDEPTNGLDPKSIKNMRDLIISLKGEHTIIISSHLLAEIEMMCDDITIINKGEVLYSGSVEGASETLKQSQSFCLKYGNGKLSWKEGFIKEFSLEVVEQRSENAGESFLKFKKRAGEDRRFAMNQYLLAHGCEVFEFYMEEKHLEDVFLDMVGGENV